MVFVRVCLFLAIVVALIAVAVLPLIFGWSAWFLILSVPGAGMVWAVGYTVLYYFAIRGW